MALVREAESEAGSDAAGAPERRAALAAAAVAAAAWLLFGTQPALRPADLAQSGVYDLVSYYAPNAERLASRLGRGELPLWNPQQGLGGPFLATLQPAALYPATALQLLCSPARAFLISLALHIALSAWFTARLAIAFGASGAASALAGLVFATSLDLTSNALVPPLLCATAWMPAVLLAVLRCIDRPGVAPAAGLALAAALQLCCGWPYLVALTALAALFCGAGALLALPRARVLPALAALAAGAAAGAALAAPQLLPALELLPQTTRALGSISAAQAVFADAPHDARLYAQRALAQGSATGIPSALALGLALVALARPGPARARSFALAAAAVLCLGASFPRALPIYDALRALPLLGDFRFPFRYRSVASLGISVLAGVGLTHAAALALRPVPVARRAQAARALLALSAAALCGSRFACAPLAPLRFPRALAPAPRLEALFGPALERALREAAPGSRSRLFWSGREGKLGPGSALDAAFDLEPFTLARSAHAFEALATAREPSAGMARPGVPDAFARAPFYGKAQLRRVANARLLDALSVDLVAFDRPRVWHLQAFAPLALGKPALYANPGALPRAYRVARAEPEPASIDAALERLLDPSFDLAGVALLDDPPAELQRPPAPGGGAQAPEEGRTELELYEPERVRIRSSGSEAGAVVLTDAWYPGWVAELDGSPARVLRANALFRAVAVPPGEHVVELRYEPRSFRIGVALALPTAALGAGLALRSLMTRRSARRGATPAASQRS